MLLADLGADVIKVEPTRGDGMRGPVVGSFMGCQRGKRDIAIDLKHPRGRELALKLVASADMVHHNMTLGTADRLGVGYEDCRSVNPDVLYCNNYMYGAYGPLAHMGGLDPLAQAASGIEWESGPVELGNPPLWYRYGHGDVAAAMPSALALLIALYHRNKGGGGQSMWMSLMHGGMLYTADSWLGPDGTPSPRPSLDARQLGFGPLYRLYETSDGWLQIAVMQEEQFAALCTAVRRPQLATDQRFATASARESNADALAQELDQAFLADLAINWRKALDAAGVPCEVSVETWDGETFLFDDELVRLGLVAEYRHPLLGRVRQFGNLISFSDTPGKQERATPMLGEHTREILGELGYDEAAIDELHADAVVSSPGEDYPYPV
jgi:crotonobetainyl-CoA:carnitine CoA-transferase CaiB-like acyl-CoA transferase